MKLTLALGLHYDNNAKSNPPVQRVEHVCDPQILPVTGAVIDLLPEPEIRHQIEFGSRRELFYLTYNHQGLPEPVWVKGSTVDVYI